MSEYDDQTLQIDDDWAEGVSEYPDWDQDVAEDLIGAIVLVGITEVDEDDETIGQHNMWGMVESADPDAGIEIELHGELAGESWICPPDLDAFEPANPGVYTLHTTGETIVDPDFTTSWTVIRPDDEAGQA